jgi:hypothetical protein
MVHAQADATREGIEANPPVAVMSTVESGAPLAQVLSIVSQNEKRDIESPLDEKQDPALAYSESRTSGIHREDGQIAIVNDGSPFPVDPNLPVETSQLTWRAVIIGSLLGLIVGKSYQILRYLRNLILLSGASNVYLGLKTGFTFGAGLFGAIFGFAIIKPLSHVLPEKLGYVIFLVCI